jgi:hypothetical protein
MLNYLKKFALDILPSVVATIIGAYIVNHYIATKPEKPAAAVSAAASKADPRKAAAKTEMKSEAKADPAKSAQVPAETASIPEPGIKAKGISERVMIENRAAEGPAEVKPVEKPADVKAVETKPEAKPEAKPAETASAPVETRRRVTAPTRDANDLARAAIERLRGSNEGSMPRAQEAARAPAADAPRLQEIPRTVVAVPAAPAVRPLPPPIAVAAPPVDTSVAATAAADPNRPTPPAEIPPAPPRPPVDLRAEAANAMSHTKAVAEDVLAAAKSMFHVVIPNSGQNGGQQFTD